MPKKEPPKQQQIWKKHKRKLLIGRSKLKRQRKELPKKWLMLKLLKRKEKNNLKSKEKSYGRKD